MDAPRVVSAEEWLTARKDLLAREREVTHAKDAVDAARRELPMTEAEAVAAFAFALGAGAAAASGAFAFCAAGCPLRDSQAWRRMSRCSSTYALASSKLR